MKFIGWDLMNEQDGLITLLEEIKKQAYIIPIQYGRSYSPSNKMTPEVREAFRNRHKKRKPVHYGIGTGIGAAVGAMAGAASYRYSGIGAGIGAGMGAGLTHLLRKRRAKKIEESPVYTGGAGAFYDFTGNRAKEKVRGIYERHIKSLANHKNDKTVPIDVRGFSPKGN